MNAGYRLAKLSSQYNEVMQAVSFMTLAGLLDESDARRMRARALGWYHATLVAYGWYESRPEWSAMLAEIGMNS